MSFWNRAQASVAISRKAEELLYERALDEFDSGEIRRGLWAQALSEAGGNEARAKGVYLRLRVRSMVDDGAIVANLMQEPTKSVGEEIEATTESSSKGSRVGTIATAGVIAALVITGYYWIGPAKERKASTQSLTQAPPCRSGEVRCLPWERDWGDRRPQAGDVVTMDGFIIGCRIYWNGKQFVTREKSDDSNGVLRLTAGGVGVSVELAPDVLARLEALPDSEYQHYYDRSIWPAARRLCNGVDVATPLPLP